MGRLFLTVVLATVQNVKKTQLFVIWKKNIGPSVIGSLTKQTTIGTGLTHVINGRSSLSFSASATRQTSAGSSSDFYIGSVSYNYQLARDWNSQLTYLHLHRTASTGATTGRIFNPITGVPVVPSSGAPADSDSIMLVVTRNFTVLPPGN